MPVEQPIARERKTGKTSPAEPAIEPAAITSPAPKRAVNLRDIRGSQKIRVYIEKANEQMAAIGFTEHGLRHAALVAAIARNTCNSLGLTPRVAELASIAAYLHDIGCVVSRYVHPQVGASIAFTLLNE